MIKTIHLLQAAKPLCVFSTEYPRDWPEGHVWQPFDKLDGGLARETGVLTKELQQPDKWKACRGCVKSSIEILVASGWKWREGEDLTTLFEKFGLPMDEGGREKMVSKKETAG